MHFAPENHSQTNRYYCGRFRQLQIELLSVYNFSRWRELRRVFGSPLSRAERNVGIKIGSATEPLAVL